MEQIGVSIVGGTGYGAGELLRLLANHPGVEIVSVISSSNAGRSISSVHQNLLNIYDLNFEKSLDFKKLCKYKKGFVITALPHGISAKFISDIVPDINANKLHLIDLSGDFRLKDPIARGMYYASSPQRASSPQIGALAEHFVFGLPEINREKITRAMFIANPGCFALTSILALAPLATLRHAANIAIDGKSGSSGAGRNLSDSFHHPTCNSNAFAYKVLRHRHEPEIAQVIDELSGNKIKISFVPHVIPCSRGIYITAHAFMDTALELEGVVKLYKDFYRLSPFIRIKDESPELINVVGSNYCDISIAVRENIVVINAATDNLIKGMCGTAIQNINLISEMAEDTGLKLAGMGPI